MLSLNDFRLIRDLIYKKSGIYFEKEKLYSVENRLKDRMEALNFDSAREYYRFIKYDPTGEEMNLFLDLLTVNETYFFRNYPQLKSFAEEIIPLIREKKKVSLAKILKIWSAACSTGEEPYTLSIILREMMQDFNAWNVQILATDISQKALGFARRGVYGERSLKDVPLVYREKYFASHNGRYAISDEIKRIVRFGYLNLIDEAKMRTVTGVDALFCRNVLIYFDEKSRKQVVNSLYDSLSKGGYVFLGHSESMSRISAAFKLLRLKNSFVYMKE